MSKEELGNLIIASEDLMYRVAKTLLYNDADCADAIQESIVKAFSNIHSLKKDAYAKSWLIRILMNECYAVMRREKKLVSLETVSKEKVEDKENDYSDLYEALYFLPENMRLAVTLYYMEGYSVKEIASLLKTTESAIKNRLLRARKRLKYDLESRENVG